ncbi:sigma factor-like helix-turn-helix DNA-binding protein, partial [Sulfurovum sp.]|uniref:sigma factor-like helix-turn-helix DNA-binding protein n=1 Tax=Sulfurovum sp. TaxID=1969726 RepID=UPI002606EA6D
DVDSTGLQEMRKASSLVKAPHVEKQLDSTRLKKYFENVQTTKERNAIICKAYQEGYSQHKIAKVLGLAQSTVSAIVKKGMR